MAVVGADKVGNHFVAITDPGSGLENTAKSLKFRKIFLNDPNIGGRYSALSYFGLVPAALLGIDLGNLLERAQKMAAKTKGIDVEEKCEEQPQGLGIIMGKLALAGRDKLTLILSPSIQSFGVWVEQLIAESCGKEGKGILPVDGEAILSPNDYGQDRFFVYLRLESDGSLDNKVHSLRKAKLPILQLNLSDLYDLGGEFFRWEFATTIASTFLKINPFDQPNVESAKRLAKEMVKSYHDTGKLPELAPTCLENEIKIYSNFQANSLSSAINEFLPLANVANNDAALGGYVSIQAYLNPCPAVDQALLDLRSSIQKKNCLAITTGYGPRFLHSTGQLHKGDGGNGFFIQLTADPVRDADIPDEPKSNKSSMTFGVLIEAQAMGDRQALIDCGRKIIRFHFSGDVVAGIKKLTLALSS